MRRGEENEKKGEAKKIKVLSRKRGENRIDPEESEERWNKEGRKGRDKKKDGERGRGGEGMDISFPPPYRELEAATAIPHRLGSWQSCKIFTVVAFLLYIYMELPALRPPTFCDTSLA